MEGSPIVPIGFAIMGGEGSILCSCALRAPAEQTRIRGLRQRSARTSVARDRTCQHPARSSGRNRLPVGWASGMLPPMSADPITRLNAALRGRYEIERELGEGGMATVYLAADLKHERKVALKVLKPELAAVVGAERFLAEIKTTANLQHPHILPLFDSGEVDGFLYYVMPYVEGETLRARLDREHQLPVEEAVRIATNVAEALDYAHRHGVIHRDVKPANILLQDGKPVVSDFGIRSGGRCRGSTGRGTPSPSPCLRGGTASRGSRPKESGSPSRCKETPPRPTFGSSIFARAQASACRQGAASTTCSRSGRPTDDGSFTRPRARGRLPRGPPAGVCGS